MMGVLSYLIRPQPSPGTYRGITGHTFLTAFGKREKEYDEKTGREIEIDRTSLDIIDVALWDYAPLQGNFDSMVRL